MEFNIKEIAKDIVQEIGYEWDKENKKLIKVDFVDIDTIEKESYLAIADLKRDIFDEILNLLEEKNIRTNM